MEMRNVNNFFVALFVSAVLVSSATAATMESPAPAPGTSSATVAFPVVGSIVGASLSAFLALLLQ
ncbi:PREDICTED: probable arabinogalactan protein 40 [Brassica oleracea var. oleracea]|uniref:probable arabinogalactan protein 40 n=1 Tax=Brassica oleracea var. oleracea TaxID=109376 RepID=UPI0006A71771|nr:PREDICTED: probable arabinogalactan protein 40 [Brassica oleracea var. oleracea]